MIFGKRSILRMLAFLAVILPLLFSATSSAAQAGDPYAVFDAVNQLRASNGLAPYQMNSALMIIAQNQSSYQASIGTWSHTDSYGTEETQRASAAGTPADEGVPNVARPEPALTSRESPWPW